MYFQKTDYTCGPAAIRIAIKTLGGLVPPEKALAEVCGSSESEGTDEDGIRRGLLHYGYLPTELALTDPRHFTARLLLGLGEGRPVILCVEKWAHWVCAIGRVGSRVIVADPARYGYNVDTNGVSVVGVDKLLRKAYAGRRNKEPYYGIWVERS